LKEIVVKMKKKNTSSKYSLRKPQMESLQLTLK